MRNPLGAMFLLTWMALFSANSDAQTIKAVPANGAQPYVVKPQSGKTPLYTESAAIVISASDYPVKNNNWQPLPETKKEMDEVARTLAIHGFEVTRVTNPTSAELQQQLSLFVQKYGGERNARIMLVYSGHGFTHPETGISYIVPIDAANPHQNYPTFAAKAITLDYFQIWARQFKAMHMIAIFDSCFSGAIFASKSQNDRSNLDQTATGDRWIKLSELIKNPVRQFISAGGEKEELPAKSVFAPLLIKGINGAAASNRKDGYVTGKELGLYLEREVSIARGGKQNPISGTLNDINFMSGDMIFQYREIEQVPPVSTTQNLPDEKLVKGSSQTTQADIPITSKPTAKIAPSEQQPKDSARSSLINNVVKGLASVSGSDHTLTIKRLKSVLPNDLSGDEIALLLGPTSYSTRFESLFQLTDKVRPNSIAPETLPKILANENYSDRVLLIRTITPFTRTPISEEIALKILGTLTYSDRSDAISIIAKIINPITANGIESILRGTWTSDRPSLLQLLIRGNNE